MGEVVPRKCVTNALPTDNRLGTLLSTEFQHMWEALLEVLIAKHAVEKRAPIEHPLIEEEEEGRRGVEEDWRRGSFSAGRLAPRQAPSLERAIPVGPGFWHQGQGVQVAR